MTDGLIVTRSSTTSLPDNDVVTTSVHRRPFPSVHLFTSQKGWASNFGLVRSCAGPESRRGVCSILPPLSFLLSLLTVARDEKTLSACSWRWRLFRWSERAWDCFLLGDHHLPPARPGETISFLTGTDSSLEPCALYFLREKSESRAERLVDRPPSDSCRAMPLAGPFLLGAAMSPTVDALWAVDTAVTGPVDHWRYWRLRVHSGHRTS